MSMHDIEGVVEASVHCVDQSKLPLEFKRNLLYNLYKFQSEFDTGYTNFRVKNILIKYHYMFELPLEKHPDYQIKKEEFKKLIEDKRSVWLNNDCIMNRETKDSPPMFYTNAGSETWNKLVESNILIGDQALPLTNIPLFDLVLEMVKLCREQQDVFCAAEWYRTTLFYLLGEATENDTKNIDTIASILFNDVVFNAAQSEYNFKRGIDSLEYEIEEEWVSPLMKEWFKVYKDWVSKNESDPNYFRQKTSNAFKQKNIEEAMEFCKKGLALDSSNSFLLLYEAILSILILSNDKHNIEDYEEWLKRLQKLQSVKNETETNTKIIRAHLLYYTAYIHMVCENFSEAKHIAKNLFDSEKMPEAKELINYIDNITKKNN